MIIYYDNKIVRSLKSIYNIIYFLYLRADNIVGVLLTTQNINKN